MGVFEIFNAPRWALVTLIVLSGCTHIVEDLSLEQPSASKAALATSATATFEDGIVWREHGITEQAYPHQPYLVLSEFPNDPYNVALTKREKAQAEKWVAILGDFVSIPEGCFIMGDDKGKQHERPAHKVCLKGFQLATHEVTFAQYDQFASATGRPLPKDRGWGRGDRPVINITYEDAEAFASWVSQVTGLTLHLPSEAQWEYAARAGTQTRFSWGDEKGFIRANCKGCGSKWDDQKTAPVGQFKPNPWGLYDMYGNVWEWTRDCWNWSFKGAPSDGSAWQSGNCRKRVQRGGSWLDWWYDCDSTSRYYDTLSFLPLNNNGFRLAKDGLNH